MSWIVLIAAGLLEIGWAVGLKYSDGFRALWPTLGTAGAMVLSVLLLGIALQTLPLGTAYAIWTGIGIIGTVILGIVLFGDPVSAVRLLFIAMIVAGIFGLKLST